MMGQSEADDSDVDIAVAFTEQLLESERFDHRTTLVVDLMETV